MAFNLTVLFCLITSCVVFSCSGRTDNQATAPLPSGVLVTRETMGESWPLIVDQARVECLDGRVAVVHVNGITYALNGTAKSRGYPAVDPIWRADPSLPGSKINIGPLIEIALKQCK